MPKDADSFGLNRDALEGALEALATGPEHDAIVQVCRTLADVVDAAADSGKFNHNASREYRLALETLMEATAHSGSDAFLGWLDQMRAPVGDPEGP